MSSKLLDKYPMNKRWSHERKQYHNDIISCLDSEHIFEQWLTDILHDLAKNQYQLSDRQKNLISAAVQEKIGIRNEHQRNV